MRRATLAIAVLVAAVAAAPAAGGDGATDSEDRIVISGYTAIGEGDVAGDVLAVSGGVNVLGRVEGDLVAVAGDVSISGTVQGDVTTVFGRATLRPDARITGDVIYGDERPAVDEGAEVGGEVREEDWLDIGDAPWAIIGAAALWIAVSLSLMVAGIVLVALLPGVADAAHRAARSQFALTLAMGLAWGVALPAIAGLSFVSLVGIPLGIVLVLALIPTAFIGYIAACHVVGRRIMRERTHPLVAFLAGLGILRALALIPVAGALVWIPAVVVGIGALTVAAMERGGGSTRAQ
jgi:cytoskeletal protein CcmA (bactofilin family)